LQSVALSPKPVPAKNVILSATKDLLLFLLLLLLFAFAVAVARECLVPGP
jgi:hypothetical protein